MLTHKDEITMFSQNVGHQPPSKVVPHHWGIGAQHFETTF